MSCYRNGGCGPYENRSCSECPANKPEYAKKNNLSTPRRTYNKKYTLDKIEEFNGHNPIYDEIELGSICYLAYLKSGERGWFLWESGDPFDPPHRIHTSVIKDVEYTRGNQVIVTTQNTSFVFTVVKED